MTIDEKNRYIEEYIRNISSKVNSQYGKELIDEDKIFRALIMFKDSQDDLETEIIPKINQAVSQVINDFIEFQKQIEEIMNKHQEESLPELATLDLKTEKNGIYLSQQQVDLLMIVDINSKKELEDFVHNCSQFPNMSVNDIIPNFEYLQEEHLDEAKRTLYQKYQDGLISYLDKVQMSNVEQAKVKLERLGINGQELEMCLSQVSKGNINETFVYLGQKYGNNFITQFNRSMNDDFENVKAISYNEMKSLSELIKNDESMDTIIIATGKFDDTVYPTLTGKIYDPYLINRSAEYCAKNGKQMRYHALFDHSHVDNLISKYIKLNGRTIEQLTSEEITALKTHKYDILSEMKTYVKISIDNINNLNSKYPGLIKQVEVFNELVKKNKSDKNSPYAMVWEKYFGISLDNIMECFPKDEKGNIIKPDGVEFMYNETTLTESSEKRKMVERILYQIEQQQPSMIDSFGDQMHTSDEDVMTEKGKRNIIETAQMHKRIQEGKLIVDDQEKTIKPKKTECTEHDHHFTKSFLDKIEKLKQNGKQVDLWKIKREQQRFIAKTYIDTGVKFVRSTYWSLFGQNDHNVVRENQKTKNETVKTMYAGLVPDGKTLPKSLKPKSQEQNKTQLTQQLVQNKQESFAQRSQSEIQIAEQIKQKNQIIKQQKAQQINSI